MKILLLGSGGREHAFAWKLSQSPNCELLYIAPGNAGTSECGINVPIAVGDFEAIGQFVIEEGIEMVICGPEDPLVNGIQDYFAAHPDLRDIAFFGPDKNGAQLEGSKAYAKAFMEEFGIPTAAYRSFGKADLEEGLAYLATQQAPIVLKADGLAAGKGVLILDSIPAAQTAFREMLAGQFGEASSKVVVEQFLSGTEFSVFLLTDGESYRVLPVAKDYKRVGEGDTGLNTGGMGSVSHPPFVSAELMQKVDERVMRPTLEGIRQRGLHYRGVVFIGLIEVDGEPYVIEYNCRMGDPETQSVFARLENDLVELCLATATGQLHAQTIVESQHQAATVIMVAGGYPGDYEKGHPISGLEKVEGSIVFHAGTKLAEDGETVLTNGGRVLAITTLAEDWATARDISLGNAAKIHFQGAYYRKDIGFDL